MDEKQNPGKSIIDALLWRKGIVDACALNEEGRRIILDIELEAEKKSLMGLGKVINTGVISVLKCEKIFAALTNMDFDLGFHPPLIAKKGEQTVGGRNQGQQQDRKT